MRRRVLAAGVIHARRQAFPLARPKQKPVGLVGCHAMASLIPVAIVRPIVEFRVFSGIARPEERIEIARSKPQSLRLIEKIAPHLGRVLGYGGRFRLVDGVAIGIEKESNALR